MKKALSFLILFSGFISFASSEYDGSRTVPVHRIPLLDEEGSPIIPMMEDALPFSANMTCGVCHDIDTIHQGTHFGGAGEGRPTEPWIAVDEAQGIQVPADRLSLSTWEFTKQFGRHHPGGGALRPSSEDMDDVEARWDVSGSVEMNCLACHNQSHKQDLSEWARQIARENFRWAATAAAGIGDVGGMASRMPDWWDPYMGGSPDDSTYRVPPTVAYDKTLFDAKHRMWFDIGKPQDQSCLQCHSTYPVGVERVDVHVDVHTAAGLSCVSCHKNGEDHIMKRGLDDSMSCAACHIEEGAIAGEAGAPIAYHKGMPPIHFEKMTCTACHSGLSPASEPHRIRTSRANRLGIYGRAQWFTESPHIVEPVYVRNEEGKIEPRRMMWPAYWVDANWEPIAEAAVAMAAKGVLDAAEQLGSILGALAGVAPEGSVPRLMAGGALYGRNVDGGLDRLGEAEWVADLVWDAEGVLTPIMPVFDVGAAEIEYEAEDAILAVMEAFEPRSVVAVRDGKRFDKDADGYLAGTATDLPTGWYDGEGVPLLSASLVRTAVELVGDVRQLNEEQLITMLSRLGEGSGYIANGRLFTLNEEGALIDQSDPLAEPISWALGHDVRATPSSIGAKSCRECHADDAPFLFGSVTATGPLLTDRSAVKQMVAFQGLDDDYHRLFGLTFEIRAFYKKVLSSLLGILVLVGLALGLPLLKRLLERMRLLDRPMKWVGTIFGVSLIVLTITGFVFGWPVFPALHGWPLLIHVGVGLLYAAALVGWVMLRGIGANRWLWLLLISGVVLIGSVWLAMFPWLGTQGQMVAIVVHRVAAVISVIAALRLFLQFRFK